MLVLTKRKAGLLCALLLLACLPTGARAAERLTLSNGFDLVCDHHAVVDGRVRVFLKAATPDYFELQADSLKAVETVPDPPPVVEAELTADAAVPAKALELTPIERAAEADVRLSNADLHELLSKAGSERNVDEDLLASVVKAESGGHTRARSRCGAQGLMQLMPGTARQLGVLDSYRPEENVRGGTAYLDSLLTRYHDDIRLAVAAYNAGPEAVDRYHGIPPYRETRVYVARVVKEFNKRVAARRLSSGVNLAAGLAAVR